MKFHFFDNQPDLRRRQRRIDVVRWKDVALIIFFLVIIFAKDIAEQILGMKF